MPETCDNSSLRSFPGIPGPATTQPCTQMASSRSSGLTADLNLTAGQGADHDRGAR